MRQEAKHYRKVTFRNSIQYIESRLPNDIEQDRQETLKELKSKNQQIEDCNKQKVLNFGEQASSETDKKLQGNI